MTQSLSLRSHKVSCISALTLISAFSVFATPACNDVNAEAEQVGVAESAIRNGTIVTPFVPGTSPVETQAIVKVPGCTGTILNQQWVITAAHCNMGVGSNIQSVRPNGTITRTVDRVEIHPSADLALGHLSSPFTDLPRIDFYSGSAASVDGKTVSCYGYGAKATSPAPQSKQCPQGDFLRGSWCMTPSEELRTGDMHVKLVSGYVFETETNNLGQMLLPGDSGGPCFESGRLVGTNIYMANDLSGSGDVNFPTVRDWVTSRLWRNDFNNDAKADISWHNGVTGDTHFWLMNGIVRGAGISVTPDLSSVVTDASGWRAVGTGDFNADGNIDILWHNLTSGDTHVWLMNGTQRLDGISLAPDLNSQVTESSGWTVEGTGDFNRDGHVDILWHNGPSGATHVWLMNGLQRIDGITIAPDFPIPDSSGWRIGGTGDFNSDGNVDILWHNGTTGVTHVWLMDGLQRIDGVSVTPDLSADLTDSSGWQVAGTGDFNSDNKVDILWHNGITGDTHVWYMNGTQRVEGVSIYDPGLPNLKDHVVATSGWQIITNGS